jgi:hypothetical protein
VGDVLAGAGVAALGTGIAFFVISGSTRDSAEGAATQAEFEDELATAKTQRTVAIASVSLGAALVVGALLRWTVFPATEEVQVGGAAKNGGGTVTLGWSF